MRFAVRLLICVVLYAGTALAAPFRVAILPLEPGPEQSGADLKSAGAAISDDLGIQLRDVPGVEWVERADLDKLLEEAALDAETTDRASSIAMGRLLKADYVIRGSIDSADETHVSVRIEAIDLTNADVFSGSQAVNWDLRNPGHFMIEENTLRAIANVAREVLGQAFETARTSAGKITLGPIQFVNIGADARLDPWSEKFMLALEKSARAQGGFRLLHFSGVTEADKEQGLSLLGLTDADPMAWRHAAQAYVWGTYTELPVTDNTAFDNVKVEADLVFWGGDKPVKFTKIFPVNDFSAATKSLAEQVIIAAIQSQHAGLGQVAATKVSDEIYAHLCDTEHSGIFSVNPDAQPGNRPLFRATWFNVMKRGGEYEKSIAFTKKSLDLACFFDPKDPRKQLIRLMFNDMAPPFTARYWRPYDWDYFPPQIKLESVNQAIGYFDQLEPMTRPSEWITVLTMDYLVTELIECKATPEQQAERKSLLERFKPYLMEYPMALLRAHPEEMWFGNPFKTLPNEWLGVVMASDLDVHTRLEFLRGIWPLLGAPQREADFNKIFSAHKPPALPGAFERLMTDLGDRKPVEDILSSGSKDDKVPGPDLAGEAVRKYYWTAMQNENSVSSPWPQPGTGNEANCFEALPSQSIFAVTDIEGFDDELLMIFPPRYAIKGMAARYNVSTGEWDRISKRPVLCADGKCYFFSNGKLSWTDLISGTSGETGPDQGMPVLDSASFGSSGRYRVMAGTSGRAKGAVVGLFDSKSDRWITAPSPPLSTSLVAPQSPFLAPEGSKLAHNIIGDGDWIVFATWCLAYHLSTHSWIDISTPLYKEFLEENRKTPNFGGIPRITSGISIDGNFWLWGKSGIEEYSPVENRVVWTFSPLGRYSMVLNGVQSDGPYLWMLFEPNGPRGGITNMGLDPYAMRPAVGSSCLLLLDRASHKILGTLSVPRVVTAFHMTQRGMYLGCLPSDRFRNSSSLLFSRRSNLYGALGRSPPESTAAAAVQGGTN